MTDNKTEEVSIMNTIYKYPLELTDKTILQLPKDAKILDVQFQNGQLFLWASVRIVNQPEKRIIRIIGTGHPIDTYGTLHHISTVQQDGFVWHVFECFVWHVFECKDMES